MTPLQREIQRYVDGELSPTARHDFERRLEAEPGLAAAVVQAQGVRRLFAAERSRPQPFSPPFSDPARRARIVAAGLAALARAGQGDDATERLVVYARRAIYAAAAVVLCAVLARSSWLATDPGQLQASPAEVQRLMEELDARRAAVRQDEGR